MRRSLSPVRVVKVIRHRLHEIDPVINLMNDDGQPGVTVIIHGAAPYDAFTTRPDPDEYRCDISRAQLQGRVYLLSWCSGFYSVNPVIWRANFHPIEENAHRLGNNLKKILSKLPSLNSQKIRLIGHSLGAHVITSGLLNNDWTDLYISDVILMGAAIGETDYKGHSAAKFWRHCISQVRGKIVNCYSGYDRALNYRSRFRRDKYECIGRAPASHPSSRIRNINFTGTLSDDQDHDYLASFNRVMNRVYRKRQRSSDYPVQVICDCPWCDYTDMIEANRDIECDECHITFEYRTRTEQPYWEHEPEELPCPKCDYGTVVVQGPRLEQCLDCGKVSRF